MSKICGIYVIKNVVDGKAYVGSSVDIAARWSKHRGGLLRGTHSNPHLLSAWRKYGESAFHFSVLLTCDVAELLEKEQIEITASRCANREYGYNILSIAGSPLGRKHSEETKRKISAIVKGRKATDETRLKISLALKGRKHTAEHTENSARAKRGAPFSEQARRNISAGAARHHSPEHVAKVAAATRATFAKRREARLA